MDDKNCPNYLVIPDIHGQYEQYLAVEKLVKEVLKKDEGAHVVFLGDYIDRGTGGIYKHYSKKFKKEVEIYFEDIGSRLVVEKLLALKDYFDSESISYTFLQGNHEEIFIQNIKDAENRQNVIQRYELEIQKNNKSKKTNQEIVNALKGFTQDFELMKKTKRFFESMACYLYDKDNKLFFTHAGIEPGTTPQACDDTTYRWIRNKFYMFKGQYPVRVVFGHTPIDSLTEDEKLFLNVSEPANIILKKDRIGLDSGNYRKNPLNVLRIKGDTYELMKIDSNGVVHPAMILNLS